MKQVYRDLCTYSADLYGINSALYELGGLIVMHDASGCNSTYNTHDEPRWYTMDSMVYVSGLIEQDAILGNDERLITDIINVVEKEHPNFVAISRSVLPTYMGTDVRGIAHIIEKRTGVPSFGFLTNGMDTYILGASAAFLAIARRFCRKSRANERDIPATCDRRHKLKTGQKVFSEPDKQQTDREDTAGPGKMRAERKDLKGSGEQDSVRVNIIGVTPLDFSINGNAELLPETIRRMGYEVQSNWAMGNTLNQLAASPDGNVSLVVSADGLDAAEYFYRTYGIPYVIGIPCGGAAFDRLKECLAMAVSDGNCYSLFSEEPVRADDPERKRVRKLYSGGVRVTGTSEKNSFEEKKADKYASGGVACDSVNSGKKRNILLIGEAVHCASIRYQLEEEYGLHDVDILCPLEKDAYILRDSDRHDIDEAHIREEINDSRIVIADPVYRRVAEKDVLFLDDPHDAYSGRMYHDLGKIFVGQEAEPFAELQKLP